LGASGAGGADWLWKGTLWGAPENYRKSSAVKGVKTPTLFIAAENGLPRYGTDFLFTALKRQGVETQYLLFKGENHVVSRPENQRELRRRVLDWVTTRVK